MDCLYNPMFGNGDSCHNYISCCTSLLGGNPALVTLIYMPTKAPPTDVYVF